MGREQCYSCGRYKLYNSGGGFICTNMRCKEGISAEQDWAEVDAIREGKKFISINPPVMGNYAHIVRVAKLITYMILLWKKNVTNAESRGHNFP